MNAIVPTNQNTIVERVMLHHTLLMLSMRQEGLPAPVLLVGDSIRALDVVEA